MTPAERCAIIGLLTELKPDKTLEVGYRFGGCTAHLTNWSGEVHSVDVDPAVLKAAERWPNVIPHHCDSKNAMKLFREKGESFDFAVIDGDHSRRGAAADLVLAIPICKVIIVHDTMNPTCRQGYMDALVDFKGFYNLNFVLNSGIWGGLGIVVPDLT